MSALVCYTYHPSCFVYLQEKALLSWWAWSGSWNPPASAPFSGLIQCLMSTSYFIVPSIYINLNCVFNPENGFALIFLWFWVLVCLGLLLLLLFACFLYFYIWPFHFNLQSGIGGLQYLILGYVIYSFIYPSITLCVRGRGGLFTGSVPMACESNR